MAERPGSAVRVQPGDPMPLNFYVLRVQTALFLSTIDLTRRLDLAVAIREGSGNILSGDPMILPVPEDTPPSFPRLVIRDTDGRWTCQVARNRIDFLFSQPSRPLDRIRLEDVSMQHVEMTSSTWAVLQDRFRASTNRIGFVARQFSLVPDANSLLREAYLRTLNFDSSHELQVHTLHRLSMGAYQVNRWLRCLALPSQPDVEGSMLRVEVDINTLPEHQIDLSAEQVSTFSHEALHLLGQTMDMFLGSLD